MKLMKRWHVSWLIGTAITFLLATTKGILSGTEQLQAGDKPVREIKLDKPYVYCAAASPNGKWLALVWSNETVEFHSLSGNDSTRQLHVLHLQSLYPVKVALSPDGKSFALGREGMVTLGQMEDKKIMIIWKREFFTGFGPECHGLTFSPDGRLIALGGDRTIKLFRVSDGNLVLTIEVKDCQFEPDGIFSPDGTLLAVGCMSTIKLFRVSDGSLFGRLWGHDNWVYSFAFSPDGRFIASGDSRGAMKLFRVSDGSLVRTFAFDKFTVIVTSLAFTSDGTLLVSGDFNGRIKLWRVSDGGFVRMIKAYEDGSVDLVAFLPNGELVSYSKNENVIKFWRVN